MKTQNAPTHQTAFNFLDEDASLEMQSNNVREARRTTQEVARYWLRCVHANNLKRNTKKRKDAQFLYLCGVASVLQTEMPQLLSLCMVSGRDLESVIEVGTSYKD